MINFEVHSQGIILPIRAQPGASSNGIRGIQNGQLKVSVTQIAEKGKANKAICGLLAKELKVPKTSVEMISGETSRQKRILIRGADSSILVRLHNA